MSDEAPREPPRRTQDSGEVPVVRSPGGLAEPSPRVLWIGHSPDPRSRLRVFLLLPVAGEPPLCLATSDTWPGPKDLFCYQLPAWPEGIEPDEVIPVAACWRQGKAVHLVLKRRTQRRSLFVWTRSRGREIVFWRSARSMRGARPGIRVPQARGLERSFTVAIDRRERHPWRFAAYDAATERRELPVGDYGVFHEGRLVAAVERKAVPDLAASLSSGKLSLALAELSRLPHAMLVVEGRLSDLLKTADMVRPGWLLNLVAALQVEFPRVTWCFAETRSLAQDLAYRWLAAALHRGAGTGGEASGADREGGGSGRAGARAGADVPAMVREAAGQAGVCGMVREGPGPYRGYRPDERSAPLDADGRRTAALAAAREGRAWTAREYARHFGVGPATARSDLKALVSEGKLIAEGKTRARRYRLRTESSAAGLSSNGTAG